MSYEKKTKFNGFDAFTLIGSFFIVLSFFPSGWPLADDEGLMGFSWLSGFFLLMRMIIMLDLENSHVIPHNFARFLSVAAAGVCSGMSLGLVFIVNEWYKFPDSGKFEPLVVACSLNLAAVSVAYKGLKEFSEESAKKNAMKIK